MAVWVSRVDDARLLGAIPYDAYRSVRLLIVAMVARMGCVNQWVYLGGGELELEEYEKGSERVSLYLFVY